MTSEHDGHFTHRPSGTRLSLFACGSIGFRTFLNQAIWVSLSKTEDGRRKTEGGRRKTQSLSRPGNVIPGAFSHAANLLDQIVHRVAAPRQVELRGFDDQERGG